MNYHSMTLPELSKLLAQRKLATVNLRNELSKVYGVTQMSKQQAEARAESIKILEEYDKNKFGFLKSLTLLQKLLTALIGLVTAAATVIAQIL